MKNTKIVVALAASGHAAMHGGANHQTFPSTMAAQTRSPKELPDGSERKDKCADRPGTALWWSVFMFFVEGFAAYGASMHPTAAFSVEAALIAARRLRLGSASRTAIATEDEHGLHLIPGNRNVVELDRTAAIRASPVARIG
jgi:hypothetical protein